MAAKFVLPSFTWRMNHNYLTSYQVKQEMEESLK